MKQVIDGITFYYDKNNGYMFNFTKKKLYLHRYIWQKHNGEIPKGFDVHHKDGNKLNNDIDNLDCISRSEHTKMTERKKRMRPCDVKVIRLLNKMGMSRFTIAQIVKRSPSTVFDVVSGRRQYKFKGKR